MSQNYRSSLGPDSLGKNSMKSSYKLVSENAFLMTYGPLNMAPFEWHLPRKHFRRSPRSVIQAFTLFEAYFFTVLINLKHSKPKKLINKIN